MSRSDQREHYNVNFLDAKGTAILRINLFLKRTTVISGRRSYARMTNSPVSSRDQKQAKPENLSGSVGL